ncbi:MAG: hypothetical protein HZA10_04400, partial [Nitrospirae bacterium]|nr:hypothetical protein [Nitrospirota bacterium]
MKRLFNYRTKLLLLTAGIFTLAIAGFLLISCGAGPQTKVTLPNAGAYAINFSPVLQDDFGPDGADAGTDHDPGADGSLDYAKRYYISLANSVSSMVNREFTIEAWVKKIPMIDPSTGAPISLSGSIFTRFGCQTGAGITLGLIGDVPSFQISNDTNSAPDCLTADGGTAAGLVNTGAAVADNIWTHIAGVFVNEIHTHAACTDASGGE